eukprot:Gb_28869 [translate_table: standard]
MGDDRKINQKCPSPHSMEDDSGLELSLGLSCGGYISKANFKDGIKKLNSDQGGNEKMINWKTGTADSSLKDFLQGSIGEEKEIVKQEVSSMHQQQETFWMNLHKNISKGPGKSTGVCLNQLQFPGFGEAWCAAEPAEPSKASTPHFVLNSRENGQTESPDAPENKGNSNTMCKYLQVPMHLTAGVTAALGQFSQQNSSPHFIDAFRKSNAMDGEAILQSHANSNSLVQHSMQLVEAQSPAVLKPSIQLDITQKREFIDMDNVCTDQQDRQLIMQQCQQDDISDQQKEREISAQKWQVARKKRKMLIEEQKQQKKAKKEDERAGPHGKTTTSPTSPLKSSPISASMQDVSLLDKEDTADSETGFRRSGNDSWLRGLDVPTPMVADSERSTTTQLVSGEGNQVLKTSQNFQQEKGRNMKDNQPDTELEDCSKSQREDSNISDHVPLNRMKAQKVGKFSSNTKNTGYLPNEYNNDARRSRSETVGQKMIEMQLTQPGIPQLTNDFAEGILDSNLKVICDSHSKQLIENESGGGLSSKKIGSGKAGMRQRTASGTDVSKKTEETEEHRFAKSTSGGFETRIVQCTTVGNISNTVFVSAPSATPGAMLSTALHYSLPSFSIMPAPYSLPVPVPNNPRVPFPVGFAFPYPMQYIPASVDGADITGAPPTVYPSGFQLPPGYSPFQLPTLEAASPWAPMLRPQQSPAFCSPYIRAARTSSASVEDETKFSQGAKSNEQRKSQRASSVEDASYHTMCLLYRPDSSSDSQEHCSTSRPETSGKS